MERLLTFRMTTELIRDLTIKPKRVTNSTLNVHLILGDIDRRGETVRKLKDDLQVFSRHLIRIPGEAKVRHEV